MTDPVKCPTEKQYALLRILGSGAVVLAPGRREWKPLLNRGWVERDPNFKKPDGRYLSPLRITVHGLRALAVAVEHYGWPPIKPEAPDAP